MTAVAEVSTDHLPPDTREFYRAGAQALKDAGVPFLVGGAYALARWTGIERHTKDFDLFVRAADLQRAIETCRKQGWRTEMPFPHWLAKAHHEGGDFIDLIFSSGNGVAIVDDEWFENAVPGEIFGMPMLLCPTEEMIWSKSFILERERFDGADVAHLLRQCAPTLNWDRLLRRFGERWRVLLIHLILFGFIYPGESHKIPIGVMQNLLGRLEDEVEGEPAKSMTCRGTLLSREQFLIDINRWGYEDARREQDISMTDTQIRVWTKAIEDADHHKNEKHGNH